MSFASVVPGPQATKRKTFGAKRSPFGMLCALLCVLLAGLMPAQAATFTVTTNADSGAGSLRQAIIDANATAGADTIAFNTPSFTIAPILAFPSLSEAVTIDGTTQPGYTSQPIIVLDGTNAGPGADGLAVRAPNVVIKGLTIQNYSGNGISISGVAVTGCRIESCRIGTNSAGTVAARNANGIAILGGANGNTVGGTAAGAGNLISGNTNNGVIIFGAGTNNNTVAGNNIGTNAAATGAIGNGVAGVAVFDTAKNNIIGGTTAAAGNLISGNLSSGIQIFRAGTSGNLVLGNRIGTNATGTAALANGSHGVQIMDGATNNIVGGATAGAGNIISGNTGVGVVIDDPGTIGNQVLGNRIGTNAAGTGAVGNGSSGIQIQDGAEDNTVGGTSAGARNIISGNTSSGIKLIAAGTTANDVIGNYIGTTLNGSAALPNASNGVEIISGAAANVIGGASSGQGNVISGNIGSGVLVANAGTSSNQVIGNLIGLNAAGTAALANGTTTTVREGLYITGGATNNVATNNTISGNTGNGVSVSGAGTNGNRLNGNRIGTNLAGNAALANSIHGVEVRSGALDTVIGISLTNQGTANTIAFNTRDGVRVSSTTNNAAIRGNSIFSNGELGINLSGGNEDINNINPNDNLDADTGANLLQNYPVLTGATLAGSNVSVTGTLNSAASTTFVIDFYSNTAADPSGAGEGQSYIGSTTVTTNASGNANISFSNSVSGSPLFITATATDPNNNTSEFSLARAVTVVQTYSISGRLTNSNGGAGIAGVPVALGGNITDNVTTNANGDYVFNGLTPGNYTVTPSANSGWSFTPTSRNVSITNTSVTGQNFAGTSTGVRIIGRVSDSSGNALGGITVTRTGTGQTTTTTNNAGYYIFSGVTPGTYTVTPNSGVYSFTPLSRTVTVAGADVTGQNFVGRTGYRIIGRISDSSGTGIAGVTVTRTGSGQTTAVTNSAGYFILTSVPNGNYTITATRTGYTFTPTSRSVTVNGADVTGQNFIGRSGPPPAPTYRIIGRIMRSDGSAIVGVSVTRTGSTTPVFTNSAGYYVFNGVPNGTYTITPSLSGYTFTPANRTATVNNADTLGNNFIGTGG